MPKPEKRYSVIKFSPQDADLSYRSALFALYALQQFESFNPKWDGTWYHHNYFYNHVIDFLNGLDNDTRSTVLKHIKTAKCVACASEVDISRSDLDHIIAKSKGGPQDLTNSILLCRRCNSSKGVKDLLEWWQFKEFKVEDLPRNILVLYCRIHWMTLSEESLRNAAPPYVISFLHARAARLFTQDHIATLYGATYAGVGLFHCMRKYDGN